MKKMHTSRIAVLTVGLVTALAIPMSAPVVASTTSVTRSQWRTASVDWLEVGTLPAPVLGNAHLGALYIEQRGSNRIDIFGYVEDYDCIDGALPGGGGGHVEEPHTPAEEAAADYLKYEDEDKEKDCELVAFRKIEAGDVAFTMDARLETASLTGTLNVVGGHDGEVLGTPPVNMTWSAFGDPFRSSKVKTSDDGTKWQQYKYYSNGRVSDVEGNIGPMIFDDETDEFSTAEMTAHRSVSRYRKR